jgi:hypothetical protein
MLAGTRNNFASTWEWTALTRLELHTGSHTRTPFSRIDLGAVSQARKGRRVSPVNP